MDTLQELEHLSLVSKIASEINNHMGVSDTTLAEFVIDTHLKSQSFEAFTATLRDMGADFPQSLVDSIDRLMHTLHPRYKQAASQEEKQRRKEHILKALTMPDIEPSQVAPDSPPSKEADILDDTFAELEGLAVQHKSNKRPSPDGVQKPRKRTHDYVFEDEYGRTERKSRRRRRSVDEDEEFRRPPTPEIDDEPILYKVYRGKVVNIKPFGVFINLQGVRGKVDGLVHVSQMQEGARVNDPSDLVSRWQEVFVKVIKMEGGKLSLSLKEADQITGRDLRPQQRIASGANMLGLNGNDMSIDHASPAHAPRKAPRQRLTSPERWEIKQLIASGVIPRSDYPDIDKDLDAVDGVRSFDDEEEVEIEVREEEPPFLVGQTKQSLELSPIRIVKNPEGSLARAALKSEQQARERRDLRQQEEKDKQAKEAAGVDLSRQWNDPMAQQKQFASDLRNTRTNQPLEAMPEWKKISKGKDASFGIRTNTSIAEQRRSLPVFKLRKQFLDAVATNSVLVCVGETGSGKTTQLTQYLAEAGYANDGVIGCTQPRRVAAMSVAKRVAEEVGCELGNEVGYAIRFEDRTSSSTAIKYMTDGILQREILLDPMLSRYSVILIDEAHERSIGTDIILALMKKCLARRPDMKLIIASVSNLTLKAKTSS
ncbi:hypothetical protein BDV96DRAFT_211984 [Lophiotrema nucula]|uniref:RNA helicase n=1 Tax=Lophiotrema nucula TaxID=690887 RepID=A0A6A5ZQL1_9PLEO|nr:hypothetical protein BDV96DRAFT_211984 [Lophiotrema nucula]